MNWPSSGIYHYRFVVDIPQDTENILTFRERIVRYITKLFSLTSISWQNVRVTPFVNFKVANLEREPNYWWNGIRVWAVWFSDRQKSRFRRWKFCLKIWHKSLRYRGSFVHTNIFYRSPRKQLDRRCLWSLSVSRRCVSVSGKFLFLGSLTI